MSVKAGNKGAVGRHHHLKLDLTKTERGKGRISAAQCETRGVDTQLTRALDDRPVVHCRTRKNGEQSCRRGRGTVFANRQIEFGAGEPDFRR